MDLIPQLRQLAERIPSQLPHLDTEEATKDALVLPFIAALGYNVFDPTEVTPALTAGVGVKRGEKVDYAIRRDGKPIILLVCRFASAELEQAHASQLHWYFTVTDARFAVLTDGVVYRFFTDLDVRNRMDAEPFLEVNLLDLSESVLRVLAEFHSKAFNQESILETASALRYTRQIKQVLADELSDPPEEFVHFFGPSFYSASLLRKDVVYFLAEMANELQYTRQMKQVLAGRMTPSVRRQFSKITKQALREVINERVHDRLKSALASEQEAHREKIEDRSEGAAGVWQ